MDCSPPGHLSMGFPRQEYWSGLSYPYPGDLPKPRDQIQVTHIAVHFFYCLRHQGSLLDEDKINPPHQGLAGRESIPWKAVIFRTYHPHGSFCLNLAMSPGDGVRADEAIPLMYHLPL